MESSKAKELLRQERLRTEQLLKDVVARSEADRSAANQSGDMFDSAEPLTGEGQRRSRLGSAARTLGRHRSSREAAGGRYLWTLDSKRPAHS